VSEVEVVLLNRRRSKGLSFCGKDIYSTLELELILVRWAVVEYLVEANFIVVG
jgi:hypothetical protein